ncbi:MAG: hypothetical protein ACI841_002824, partial [Planctomycetota bacterium]
MNCHASVLESTMPSCRLRLVVSECLDRLAVARHRVNAAPAPLLPP